MTALRWASLSRPIAGETTCGDVVAMVMTAPPAPGGHWLAVIDGLGHGPDAALAAQTARHRLEQSAHHPGLAGHPDQMLLHLDMALGATRGAAIGLTWIAQGRLRHAGVGNTRALRWRAGQTLRLPSSYGIVGEGRLGAGHGSHRVTVLDIDLQPGDWILLFTDGLDESLTVGVMLPEWVREPERLCEHLMTRGHPARDDAAVLVAHVQPDLNGSM
ncbi:SpoIIE family protein phosphatase [Sphaerotilus sp.]|uniref:SpoIIE family protein phosphatase n=1 Tax=Sphaerotilus sp. TaxID=2093942 RepID=UPI002ACEA440|nr:SpoIIE family protein phosphatase [Sphaerotilus sp.]MDZ7854738.1 SpoIIE family protein phosphatase [Sphaerotilus sp.]